MYEVYICKLNDEVLYVGQGKLGRHNHCKSGCSHVYELNKLHFAGEDLGVEVVNYFDSRHDSLSCEKELIKKLLPKFNIKQTFREGGVQTTKKFIDKFTNTLTSCGYRVRECEDFRCVRNVLRKFDNAVVHLHIEIVDYLGGFTYQSQSKQLDESIATNQRLDEIILDLNSRLDSSESDYDALLLRNSLLENNVDKLSNTVAEYNLQKLKISRLKWWQRLLFVFTNKLHG